MIPVKPIVDGLKKVNWKKVGDVAKKVGEGAVVVATTIKVVKEVKGDDGFSRKVKKELKELDKMLRKGEITKEEYEKMRERIINM